MKSTEQALVQFLCRPNTVFAIPVFQRPYEWDKELCEVFLQDVKNTALKNRKSIKQKHFFGTITYYKETNHGTKYEQIVLVDGQQRITTTMLFLAAVRDSIADLSKKEEIDNRFLQNKKHLYKMRLKSVETDRGVFGKIIRKTELEESMKESPVYQNYLFFLKEIKDCTDKELLSYVQKGMEEFTLITIELLPYQNRWEKPQEVFETMNSLGKPLELKDLVCNYLLLDVPVNEQDNYYKHYWNEIESRLKGNVSNFIRDYMQYKKAQWVHESGNRNNSNHKILYNEFKKLVSSEMKVDSSLVIQELNRYSLYYAYIVRGEETGDILVDDKLRDLRRIGISIPNPLVLAILILWKETEAIDEHDVREILDALVVYFMRRKIAKLAQGENKAIPRLINRLPEIVKARDKKKKMFNILGEQEYNLRLPNDAEVRKCLVEMNFYNFKYAKFLFTLMEEKKSKGRLSEKDRRLSIEHIMPQNPRKDNKTVWEKEIGKREYERVHQQYKDNIGNLCLVHKNSEESDKSFKEKKKYYKTEGLWLANEKITSCSKWNETSIVSRQRWITRIIIKETLPIPENMRKQDNYKGKKK